MLCLCIQRMLSQGYRKRLPGDHFELTGMVLRPYISIENTGPQDPVNRFTRISKARL